MPRQLNSIGLFAIGVLFCNPTLATTPNETCPQRPSDRDVARIMAGEWFARGTKHVKEEQYAEAEEAYKCSYALVPHPATLLNLAKAANLVGHTVTAIEAYSQFIEKYPNEEKKTLAASELERISKNVPSLNNDFETSDDSEEAAATQLETRTPEQHSAEAQQKRVPPPERMQVDPRPSNERKQPHSPEPQVVDQSSRLKTSAIALIGVGGLGVAAGLAFGATTLFFIKKAGEEGWLVDILEYQDKMKKFGIASIVTLSVGEAVLIYGMALLLIDKRRRTKHRLSRLEFRPSPNGLGLYLAF